MTWAGQNNNPGSWTGQSSPPGPNPLAQYLHSMEPIGAMRVPDADPQSSLLAASMGRDGISIQMQDGAGATPLSMAHGIIWKWPIPADILGFPVPMINLGERLVQLAVLERSISATPMGIGVVWGLHEGADPNAAGVEGMAMGLEYNSTTLRSTVWWRKVAGVWTRTVAGTGQAACFGAEWVNARQGPANIANNKVLPLDSTYKHGAAGGNVVDNVTNITNIEFCDTIFLCAYWTSTAAGTPTIVVDTSTQIMPLILHA